MREVPGLRDAPVSLTIRRHAASLTIDATDNRGRSIKGRTRVGTLVARVNATPAMQAAKPRPFKPSPVYSVIR